MFASRTRLTLGLLTIITLLTAAIVVGGPAALALCPALLAVVPFLFGRYPGENILHRLTAHRQRSRSAPTCRALPRAPRSLGRRLSPLAVFGSARSPPALART